MQKSLVSIADLNKADFHRILQIASQFQKDPPHNLLKGHTLASCFFEPSTRTRLSFESAMYRLGGNVIGFSDSAVTSAKKGESLSDSIRIISSYADILVLRHPQEGAARLASEVTDKPIINAGDGANQHPSQTLLDLFSIVSCQNRIEELHIAIAGDLKYGRTVHSLALALAHYAVRLYFISPDELLLPDSIAHELRKKGVKFSFHGSLDELMPKLDVLYMTRIQKERFVLNGESFQNPCILRKKHLETVKPNFRILHPLPRIDEIEPSIDTTPYAFYFQQAALGLPVRMALLAMAADKI